MDLAINPPHHIATFGDVLLLTTSHMISQLLKCTGSSPHLLMCLHGPKNRSLLLFWKLSHCPEDRKSVGTVTNWL